MLFIKVKDTIFESKSQHQQIRRKNSQCCLSKSKIQFLKANHNKVAKGLKMVVLFIKVKDTIFESKSQQSSKRFKNGGVVYQSQRYNF